MSASMSKMLTYLNLPTLFPALLTFFLASTSKQPNMSKLLQLLDSRGKASAGRYTRSNSSTEAANLLDIIKQASGQFLQTFPI